MSTRGSVAWLKDGEWLGVYNHHDSYPSGLGMSVFETAKRLGADVVVEKLQSCNRWKYVEREAQGQGRQFDPREDALFMEYVYLIRPEENVIEIWEAVKEEGPRNPIYPISGVVDEHGYTHAHIATVDLSGHPPDWEEIERMSDQLLEVTQPSPTLDIEEDR